MTAQVAHQASSFLPRYSGVRPIISPAMNTVISTWNNMQYMPQPMPPNSISPIRMFHSGIMPASGIQLSCMELTEPLSMAVQEVRPQHAVHHADPLFLAFHVRHDAPAMTGLGCVSQYQRHGEGEHIHGQHDVEQTPGVLLVADQQAEHIDLRHRHDDDRQHFQEIRQRRGVFKRMRAVDVVPAAAVGEELFDGLEAPPRGPSGIGWVSTFASTMTGTLVMIGAPLASTCGTSTITAAPLAMTGWPLASSFGHGDDQLDVGGHVVAFVIGLLHLGRVGLHQVGVLVGLEGLRHALPGQRNGPKRGKRNDEVEQAAGQVRPEIAHGLDRGALQGARPPPPAPPAPKRR